MCSFAIKPKEQFYVLFIQQTTLYIGLRQHNACQFVSCCYLFLVLGVKVAALIYQQIFFIHCLVIVKKSSPKNLSADCRSSVGRLSAVCWPTVGRLSADCWPTVGRQTADRFSPKHRLSVGRQSADSW